MLGIDVGGTFTDLIWSRPDQTPIVAKVPSSPEEPSRALLQLIAELGVPGEEEIVHGSTVATNVVLEGTGARVALVTTRGFEDVIEIGRQTRQALYDLNVPPRKTLVARDGRFGVTERVTAEGEVHIPLDETNVDTIGERIADSGFESVAVSLLFSFLHPAHEEAIREALTRRLGADIPVSLSSVVLPEFREYERTSTTVLNAYVAPVVGRYVSRLRSELPNSIRTFSSSGGSLTARETIERPVQMLLSGPAGGVTGAFAIAQAVGVEQVITFDMGGTSTDVALCPGEIPRTSEGEIAGLPVWLQMVDIWSVGAGGGSIAQVDAGGALEVGPRSAGADPGPAAYGKGTEPTVTDANVVLGRLPASTELGGTLLLDGAASGRSVAALAKSMGTDVIGAALGVIRVANSNVERALRRVSVERGHDPREFVLVAFGGAGPLHACELAKALDVRKVLVPRYPGVTSAAGMLVADATRERSRTLMVPGIEWTIDELKATFGRLADEVEDEDAAEAIVLRSADIRYLGQGYELNVPLSSDDPGELIQRFHEAHEQRFGHSDPEREIEIVSIRVRRVEISAHRGSLTRQLDQVSAREAGLPTRAVGANRHEVEATLFDREELGPGSRFVGPAIVTQPDATTYIPAGWRAIVDTIGNLILEPDSKPTV